MTRTNADNDGFEIAVRALRAHDRTRAALAERLDQRGVPAEERDAALERLEQLGYVDDVRFAHDRAAALAARGSGNRLIAADLERQGVTASVAADAIDVLPPERSRADAIVARRGVSLRTARLLAQRGFGEDVVAGVVAAVADDTIG